MTLSAEVRRITDPKDVHIVQSIHEQVWHDDYSAQCRAIAEALQNYPERLSVYVVYADGVPVSCARVSWMGPIHFAYLYGGCTLPAYQKRGFYSALVAVRAREAKRLGVRFLAVDAKPMSQPTLLKLGFQFLTYSHKLRR